MGIRFLSRDKIDDKKWDDCINRSSSNIVYGLTWYLDAITSKKWSAYILDDYEAVMPFIRNYTFLFPNVTTPLLCQQLGIFLKKVSLSQKVCDTFYAKLKSYGWKYDIKTKANLPDKVEKNEKINHILWINKPYQEIETKYNRNTKRNISQAKEAQLTLVKTSDYSETLSFLLKNDPSGIILKNKKQFKDFMTSVHLINKGFCVLALENEEIRAAAFFIDEGDRLYFMLCASDDRGKKTKAMYLIIDDMIRNHAGIKNIFDFTGSSIDSIAQRNEGFGGAKEIYYHLTWKLF
ncbi:MAG: hypothetical protein IPO92_10695 [Saprospiraceae bacterium]|nr:hypothetical protein [Saprospiraceae bacterium]